MMILVTGATSAVGKAAIEELLERKIAVRAFVRKPVDAENLAAQGVEGFVGDMTERKSAAKALQGIKSLYLISPVAENQLTTEQLWAEEAKKAGLSYIVKQSEIGADPQSFSPLLQSHGKAEEAIRNTGIPSTILRTLYFMHNFGPMYARSIISKGMIYIPLADARISYVDARDVGAVAAHLLTEEKYKNQTYEVAGPEALSCTQLAEIFSSALHTPVHYTSISDKDAEQALLQYYPPWTAHAVVTLLQFYRQGGGDVISRVIEDVTARKPRTVAAYINENIHTFKAA